MNHRTAMLLGVLILIGLVVQLGVIAYVGYSTYQGRKDTVKYQRAGCERSKLDRTDNADFQKAQSVYIRRVTRAVSVKEDVKIAAREARKTFKRTSASLGRRSKINCETAFPNARIIP